MGDEGGTDQRSRRIHSSNDGQGSVTPPPYRAHKLFPSGCPDHPARRRTAHAELFTRLCLQEFVACPYHQADELGANRPGCPSARDALGPLHAQVLLPQRRPYGVTCSEATSR